MSMLLKHSLTRKGTENAVLYKLYKFWSGLRTITIGPKWAEDGTLKIFSKILIDLEYCPSDFREYLNQWRQESRKGITNDALDRRRSEWSVILRTGKYFRIFYVDIVQMVWSVKWPSVRRTAPYYCNISYNCL